MEWQTCISLVYKMPLVHVRQIKESNRGKQRGVFYHFCQCRLETLSVAAFEKLNLTLLVCIVAVYILHSPPSLLPSLYVIALARIAMTEL